MKKRSSINIIGIIPVFCICLLSCGRDSSSVYYPPSDGEGGWRKLEDPQSILETTGVELEGLDYALEIAKASTRNGGLLVVRKGWLIYEAYFGLGHRESLTNLASVGKPFTSMAAGILMNEQPGRFPDGLNQRIYNPDYLPAVAFPLGDPAKSQINLGQLLSFTAGIRGNNPSYVYGDEIIVDPPGLDGWPGMVDEYVVGKKDYLNRGSVTTASSLWIEPGSGYSYATASIHLVSMMVRHLTGIEMENYLRLKLADPMGFMEFTFGYRNIDEVVHTTGGGGVVVRPTDMLRFGYLLLNRGNWEGRSIVPADYVDHCRQISPYNPHYPYSLQFDVNTGGQNPNVPRDAFWKTGSGGHALFVVPSLNLVVWKLGGRDSQYDSKNTGLELHPDAPKSAPDRENWKANIEINDAYTLILNTVVSAVSKTQ
ncbi:MAG: serine hydrolase [Verrucomicrobia bacterium]|nr:serine hydrolase [Verrucomicrobiota bacterium]MDA1066132.1 serine hydrolase [Verrucomicrobiota bacterium]